MTTKTKFSDSTIEETKRIDLVQLVGANGLRRVAGDEYEGPCPRCGGEDRFHVKPDGWFCRQCKPLSDAHGWHSAIDYVMWRDNLPFPQAVRVLTGDPVNPRKPVTTRRVEPPAVRQADPPPSTDWQARAQTILDKAQAALWKDGARGADYLLGRGLEPATWRQFGAGYWGYRTPEMTHAAPAIVLPWYGLHGLSALRYRFLEAGSGPKIKAERGSTFRGIVFGRNAINYWRPEITRNNLTLVLCEGELNAMSIWQAQHEASVEVLSLGSESAKVPDGVIKYAQQFRHVLVWMDKPPIVRNLMALLPGAHGVNSPEGRDANDLLQAGLLGEYLTQVRIRMCRDAKDREHLYWTLWDAMQVPGSYDARTARVLQAIKP